MGRRQHHKGRKRLRGWHRGHGEARRWRDVELPDLATGATPSGEPVPVHRRRRTGKQPPRGEAV